MCVLSPDLNDQGELSLIHLPTLKILHLLLKTVAKHTCTDIKSIAQSLLIFI